VAPGKLRLVKDIDYYMEGDAMVFTARYLLKRAYCCNSGCRHCPYGDNAPTLDVKINVVGAEPAADE
jgi:hypothetical protein